jgi:hypothetical protein
LAGWLASWLAEHTAWNTLDRSKSLDLSLPLLSLFTRQIRHTKNQQDLFWRTAAFTKNHWKFFLDSVVPRSGPDRVIAVIDDDSCFIDHFVLDDIVGESFASFFNFNFNLKEPLTPTQAPFRLLSFSRAVPVFAAM